MTEAACPSMSRPRKRDAWFFVSSFGAMLLALPVHAQMQVRVEAIRLAPLVENLPLAGSVLSPRSSDLAAQESGLVREIRAEIGDRVAPGATLVQLDSDMARLELDRLLAEEVEARVRHEDAVRLVEEGRRLVGERNFPRTEYETRVANEGALSARLQQLHALVEAQRLRVARHEIRAPYAGVIGARLTEVGEWLAAGAPAVQLVQLDPLRVQARIPERYFAEIHAGTPVSITLDAVPGKRIEARVDSVVAVSEGDVRSFIARVDVPNPESGMAPGMSARVDFQPLADNAEPVLQVPADAIIRLSDGSAVVWLVRDGKAISVPVTVGRRMGSIVEIRAEGLEAGEQVITMGNEGLSPGEPVIAVAADAAP